MLYLDTSLLVSAFTIEARTAEIQDWLGRQETQELAISDWVVTEFSSALSLKLRTRQLDDPRRRAAHAHFATQTAASMTFLPITSAHFRAAATYAEQHPLGLRAADALHLAIAVDYGATICTLDRTLAEAGATLGASTALI